jgi:hypothetical protein
MSFKRWGWHTKTAILRKWRCKSWFDRTWQTLEQQEEKHEDFLFPLSQRHVCSRTRSCHNLLLHTFVVEEFPEIVSQSQAPFVIVWPSVEKAAVILESFEFTRMGVQSFGDFREGLRNRRLGSCRDAFSRGIWEVIVRKLMERKTWESIDKGYLREKRMREAAEIEKQGNDSWWDNVIRVKEEEDQRECHIAASSAVTLTSKRRDFFGSHAWLNVSSRMTGSLLLILLSIASAFLLKSLLWFLYFLLVRKSVP